MPKIQLVVAGDFIETKHKTFFFQKPKPMYAYAPQLTVGMSSHGQARVKMSSAGFIGIFFYFQRLKEGFLLESKIKNHDQIIMNIGGRSEWNNGIVMRESEKELREILMRRPEGTFRWRFTKFERSVYFEIEDYLVKTELTIGGQSVNGIYSASLIIKILQCSEVHLILPDNLGETFFDGFQEFSNNGSVEFMKKIKEICRF